MDDLEEIVARLVRRVEGRYYGKYRGIVTDNDDPSSIGRLRARVPQLLGDVELGWALPCAPYGGTADQGFFAVPDVDASVWIEFEGGDLDYPIWSGTWWGTDEVPESATPAQKVLKTAAGHTIVLDDEAETATVTDSNGNVITMDSAGVTVEDVNGNTLTMDSSGITAAGATIAIGGTATDNLVAYNMLNTALQQFVLQLSVHTHTGNLGAPTSPPLAPITLTLDSAKSHHELEL